MLHVMTSFQVRVFSSIGVVCRYEGKLSISILCVSRISFMWKKKIRLTERTLCMFHHNRSDSSNSSMPTLSSLNSIIIIIIIMFCLGTMMMMMMMMMMTMMILILILLLLIIICQNLFPFGCSIINIICSKADAINVNKFTKNTQPL